MELRVFEPTETNRKDLTELLFQLSGKKRELILETHPNRYCIGAFDGLRLIGFAQLFILPKTTFVMAYVEDVIVHEEFRGKGIGRQLMEEIISLAKRESVSSITLTTRPEREAAVSLYESLGFIQPGSNVYRLQL